MKPYPSYRPTGLKWLPEVPREWEMLHLFQVAHETCCKNVGCREMNVLSLSFGSIKRKQDIYAGLSPTDFATYQIVEPGNTILRLTDLQNDKRSLRTGLVKERGIITSAYTCVVPHGNADYLHYALHTLDLHKIYYGLGGGVRQSIGFKEIRQLQIPVPPLPEQAAIVAYLDAKTAKIDRLIKLKEREIELLQEKKQAVISTVVTRGLDPNVKLVDSGVAWLGKTPQGWKVMPLKRLLISRVSGSWGIDVPSGEGMICLRIADFDYPHGVFKDTPEDELTHRGYQEREVQELTLEQGDILVEKSGGGDKFPVGRAVMFDKPYKALYANFMDRLRVDRRKALPAFYLHWWRTMYARGVVWPYVKQTTGIQNLDFGNLLAHEYIAVPKLEEQRRIVDVITERITPIDRAIAVVRRQIELLREYRTRLISDAVTGRIDLREAVA